MARKNKNGENRMSLSFSEVVKLYLNFYNNNNNNKEEAYAIVLAVVICKWCDRAV